MALNELKVIVSFPNALLDNPVKLDNGKYEYRFMEYGKKMVCSIEYKNKSYIIETNRERTQLKMIKNFKRGSA